MARRHKAEDEHENHERWLVSYADFITLLFAFFVVMYSLSSVNEGKYRVLSDSIVQAFRNIDVNATGKKVIFTPPVPSLAMSMATAQPEAEAKRREAEARRKALAEEIKQALEPLARSGQVSVTEGALGISVEINANVLFATGEAALGGQAIPSLQAVAGVVAGGTFPIVIEGHTDDTPISTYRFPSNWELSAARASSVVRLFAESGVSPSRLTASGYGDQRPVAENLSEQGRARNRRVTLLMQSMTANEEAGAAALPTRLADDPIRSILPGGASDPGQVR
ncbi:MAG: flagellar motor protein MotD [Zoogloeaceae bacterium]|nr:flagellar motor protein MotD [Zoogloeaceae bacterium]